MLRVNNLTGFNLSKITRRNIVTEPPGEYVAGTAVFDGTDFMSVTSSAPSGLTDGRVFTCSVWLKDVDGASQDVLAFTNSGGTVRMEVHVKSDNRFGVFGRNSSGTTILTVRMQDLMSSLSAGWHHFYVCIDLTDSNKRKIYVDGVQQTLSATITYTNDNLDLVGSNYRYGVGAIPSNSPNAILTGSIAELWWDDIYLDDPSAFRTSENKPKNLGNDGSTPTGSQPVFYFKGAGNNFNVNSGSGPNMTITGDLGETTPP